MIGSAGLHRAATRATKVVLDALLPPHCLACETAVDHFGALCPSCWRRLSFISAPQCALCGVPFEYDLGDDALCAACTARRPAYDRARAVLLYDETSRGLVLGFKHGDRLHGANAFGAWLARAGAPLLAQAELLVPVPLHRRRLFARRYNQAALLAHAAGRASGVKVASDLLKRLRATPSQGGMSASERRRNVRGAFEIAPGREAEVAGRALVLVDDVFTTGATAEACARALKRGGAGRVDVLTLARVVRAPPGSI